jgi:predicted RNase H-like HicB family nuclease
MTEIDRYLILIEGGSPSNFSAWSPDVPGCAATGSTLEECVQEMRIALAAHVGAMQDQGEEAPQPSGPGVYVERAIAA